MADIGDDLRALAFLVAQIRPTWPRALIETALADDPRDLGTLARAAIQAAQNPSTRHPNGIRSTFPGADNCTRCAERERSQSALPPPVVRCEKCGRITDEHHTCPTGRPPWWTQAQQINAQYAASIRAARTVGDHKTAADLTAKQRTELAKVMA